MRVDAELDANVRDVLPLVDRIIDVVAEGSTAWAKAYRINVRCIDQSTHSYFMKESRGEHGREALKGEFASTEAIHAIMPDFCPKPLATGTFASDSELHFYICDFYEFFEGVPEPLKFCEKVAELHSKSTSPNGKFGFPCVTYNGDLPQDNTWNASWEAFFTNGLRHVLRIREERAGLDLELDGVLPALFDKVIPRLLRPLESHGRVVKPVLVHGDLWCGNAGIIDETTGGGIIFDPSSFYAHNEYELGNWRPKRNKFTEVYSKQYHQHISTAEPKGDGDDRNSLYSLRFNLHAAALFPDNPEFLTTVKQDIQRLNSKHPDGYTGQ